MAPRGPSTPLTLRVDKVTRARLDRLARATSRTRAFRAAEAIQTYLDQNEWQAGAIHDGVADADAEQLIEHERVAGWLRTWGTSGEKKRPR